MSDELNNQMTVIGGFGFSTHRNLSVQKVDNGYIMKFKVTKSRKPQFDNDDGFQISESICVFHTIPEVLDAVRTYLEASATEIRNA